MSSRHRSILGLSASEKLGAHRSIREHREAAPVTERLAAVPWCGGLQQAVKLQAGKCQAQMRIN